MVDILEKVKNFFGYLCATGEVRHENRIQTEELDSVLVAYSALRLQFIVILTLSTMIGTLGLLGDSAVAIVGAMLISPLMKPIIAHSYGIANGNWRLRLRASMTLIIGLASIILVSWGITILAGLEQMTNEIIARTHPTLIDLGIAIAAGIAASMAITRKNVADTLPGVAIAVALVPPVCVVGISIAERNYDAAIGSALLFGINLVAIILCAVTVFIIDGYGSLRKASKGFLLLVIIAVVVMTLPLSQQLRVLQAKDHAQHVLEDYLRAHYEQNRVVHPSDLSQLDTLLFPDHAYVFMEIKAPAAFLTDEVMRAMYDTLSPGFEVPLDLKVQIVTTEEKVLRKYRPGGDGRTLYGVEDIVPRR